MWPQSGVASLRPLSVPFSVGLVLLLLLFSVSTYARPPLLSLHNNGDSILEATLISEYPVVADKSGLVVDKEFLEITTAAGCKWESAEGPIRLEGLPFTEWRWKYICSDLPKIEWIRVNLFKYLNRNVFEVTLDLHIETVEKASYCAHGKEYVYVADHRNHQIQKFDTDGNFILKWRTYATKRGEVNQPWPNDVSVDNDGNVWISYYGAAGPAGGRLSKATHDGKLISPKRATGAVGHHRLKHAVGVATNNTDSVFVAGGTRRPISRWTFKSWDSPSWGMAPHPLYFSISNPSGIAVDSKGALYVSTRGWMRKSQPDALPGRGSRLLGTVHGLDEVQAIDVDKDDNVYVLNWKRGGAGTGTSVLKYDENLKLLSKFKYGKYKGREGEISGMPRGIAVDSVGNIYISDTANHRIQKFDASGKFVKAWGSYGTTGGCACLSPPGGKFDTPRGLDVGCKRAGKTTTGSVGKKRYWKKRHVMKLGVATVKLDR